MYRKKGMEKIQDSLLADLERATTNLKRNPSKPGGWKLNSGPGDVTINSEPAYTTAKVAKHYSPQYYVPEEPIYQNGSSSLKRSTSNGSAYHDYARINGADSVDSARDSPMYSSSIITKGPSTYIHSKGPARPGHGQNSGSATIGYVNGSRTTEPSVRSDEAQVNELIKDLEFSLQSNGYSKPNYGTSSTNYSSPYSNGSATMPLQKQKSVTFEDDLPKNSSQTDSAPYKATTVQQARQMPIVYSNGSAKTGTNGRSPSPTRVRSPIEPEEEYHRNLVNLQPQQVKVNSNPIIELPIGSHATRELDDLMASLNNFKMNQVKQSGDNKTNYINLGQVQVPRKGHGERQMLFKPANPNVDLESMIGDLEADMTRQGLNVGPKGDCGACGRPIVGQVVAALGKLFHPEHFRCAKCNTELGDKAFFEREDMAYCQDDYHRLFSPKCAHCNEPILDRCITALDRTWHPEHFFCAHCGQNFGDDGYHEKNGSAYCREDFFKLFAPKCMGCHSPIVDNYVEAMGGHWHQDCFVCRDCNEPFHGGNFFDFEGNPYCEPHFHNKKGNVCATCRNPIVGRCITAMNQKYHPEHFTCSFCLKQLNKGTFKKHLEKPYCHGCFEKLFA